MQIPLIPNYNSKMHSGCSMKYANFITRKRMYISGVKYALADIPILAVFDFIVKHEWGRQRNYAMPHNRQFLEINDTPDFDSPISLN